MLDIIIVNYKSTGFLKDCLESLSCDMNGCKANVFVFDNRSNDGVEKLRKTFPTLTLVCNDCNVGFAGGVNQLLSISSNPYILLLNPDTIVFKGFLVSIQAFMKNNPDTGILGPLVLDPDGCIQGSARSFPSFHTVLFGRSSLISKIFPNNPFTRANMVNARVKGQKPLEVDWVSGACMVVRRKAVEEVGPLDENFFMYWEDADWCSRMWKKGWKVKYWTGAAVMHHVGGSSDKNRLKSIIEFHKSAFRLYRKHNPRSSRVLEPLVLLGLFCRLLLVMGMQTVRYPATRMIDRSSSHKK